MPLTKERIEEFRREYRMPELDNDQAWVVVENKVLNDLCDMALASLVPEELPREPTQQMLTAAQRAEGQAVGTAGWGAYARIWRAMHDAALVGERNLAAPLWMVRINGEIKAAYPRKVQAEVYASGFLDQNGLEIVEGLFAFSPQKRNFSDDIAKQIEDGAPGDSQANR